MPADPAILPRDPAALRGLLEPFAEPLLLLDERLELVVANAAARQALDLGSGRGLHALHTGHGGRLVDWLRLASRAQLEGRRGPAAPPMPLSQGRRASLELVRLDAAAGERARWLLHARPEERHVASIPRPGRPPSPAQATAADTAPALAHELEQWLALSPLAMVLFDAEGQVLRANPAFAAIVGDRLRSLDEAVPALQRLLGWDADAGAPALALEQTDGVARTEARLVDPQGRTRWLVGRLQPLAAPSPGRYMAVLEDRSLEQERDLAHQQLDALMDTAGVGLATFQQDAGWLRPRAAAAGGPGVAGNTGGPAGGALSGLQGVGRDIVEPDSLPEFERLQRALKSGERVEVRYAVRHPELGRRWLLTRVEPGQLGSGQRTTSVITVDVTAEAKAQARNEQLLHELATIMDGASLGLAYLRGARLVRCNRGFERMLGLPERMAGGTPVVELFAGVPAVARQVEAALPGLTAERGLEAEFQPVGAGSGPQPRWLSLSLRRVNSAAGTEPEAIAVVTDISRLKAQQSELEALVQDRELMFSLSDVGIAILRNGRIARANEALAALTGYRIRELDGLAHRELFDDEQDFAHHQAVVQQALERAGMWRGERRVRRRDGTELWMQISKRVMRPGAPDEGLIATYVNVDDRWRAQQSLMLQTERERAILDSVLVGIVTVGRAGIEWMNRSARRMFGGDLIEFVGQAMAIVATPDPDHPFRQTHYLDELDEGQTETFECRLQALDGREFWVVGNAVVTGTQASGRQLTYALLDIERRRQAEAQTQLAQASLTRIIEAAPVAISLHDAQTLAVEQINQAAADLAGRSEAELMGATPEELFGSAHGAQIRQDMLDALLTDAVTHKEYKLGSGEHQRVWDARLLHLAPTVDSASGEPGAPEQLLFVASDVTEQRAAEEARLQAAISQRELLVREVHHRIKNNLQGVAGLLQQIAARRPEVAPVINEAVGQVQAIAQVYGLQVGSSGPLRVQRVIEAIIGAVQRSSGRQIAFAIEGEGELAERAPRWMLPEAESIPIALTLNELLGNALKHGGGSAVSCTLVCGDVGVAVEIRNRGTLPPDFDIMKIPGGVSGLGLVRALLPRRSASLGIEQRHEGLFGEVLSRVELWPPSVSLLEAP